MTGFLQEEHIDLSHWDTNGDGGLDLEELTAAFGEPTQEDLDDFHHVDTNADGKIDQAEFDAAIAEHEEGSGKSGKSGE